MRETVDRRHLRFAAALMLLAGASLGMGCGGGSTSPTTPPQQGERPAPVPFALPPGAIAGFVSENHDLPHRAVITEAELRAGGALTLDIQGDALHRHMLSLTGAEVTQIARGARISKVSSIDVHLQGQGLHNHTITFN